MHAYPPNSNLPVGVDRGGPWIGNLPDGMYGIFATLKGYSAPNRMSQTVVRRFEKSFERKVEKTRSRDFLARIQGILQRQGMKRVIMINRNDRYIYGPDQSREEDWSRAFEIAANEATDSEGTEEWWIRTLGNDQQFKFRQSVAFREKHLRASPMIVIEIEALPVDWARGSQEDFNTWMNRLEQALAHKEGVKAKEAQLRPAIDSYLNDYQRLLKDSFPIEDVSKSLKIDLSGIELQSFYENETNLE